MVLRISRLLGLIACSALVQIALTSNASADERITDDYIALVFEAEDNDRHDERWVLTNSGTAEQENDPDGNHSDGAAGGAYIELLPDMRVTHEDEFGPPTAFWNVPGTGPKAEYTMNFPEAGRYYVHIRAYSTGTEDNGIHVGINDTWPDSGARMQFCTAGSEWQWSGRQRYSGGGGACGARKTIWITVEEAGEQTFMISAREDGFEADRIMLIKDLSNNTRICSPNGIDDIKCVNGSLENVDEIVDMAVSSTVSQPEIELGSSVLVSIVVRNDDGYDSASDVILRVAEGIGTHWNVVDLPEGCEFVETSISCDLGTVTPSFRGEEGDTEFEFAFEPLQSGELDMPVSIGTSSVDGSEDNDAANQSITVTDYASSLGALSLELADTNLTWQSNTESRVVAIVSNSGPGDATDVVLSIGVPEGLTVSDLPPECTGTTEFQCDFETISVDSQVSLNFGITPAAAGLYSVSVGASASNLNGEAAASTIIVDVEDADGVDAGADTGSVDAGADTGSVDAGADTGGVDAGADTGSDDTGTNTDTGGNDTGTDTGGNDIGTDTDTGGNSIGGSSTGADAGSGNAGSSDTDEATYRGTDGGTDGAVVINPSVAGQSSGGTLVWWTLMLLAMTLCMRQIHLPRVGCRTSD